MAQLNRKTFIAAAVTGLLAATGAQAQVSDDVVRIGVMADQTGPYSGNGGPGSTLAVRMAVEDAGGRVLGKPIEVIVADDQNKPDVGTNIARQWLEQQKVDTIVGGSASAIALSVSNMMKAAKKPYLLAGSVSTDLTGKACSPMSIQFGVDTYSMPKAGVRGLVNQGVKTFYFITVEGAFGDSSLAAGRMFIEQSGASVVGNVKHPLGTTDFSSYLLQAQASKAKIIGLANAGGDTQNAIKQAAEFGITRGGQNLAGLLVFLPDVHALGLDKAQGLIFTETFYWDLNDQTRAWTKRFVSQNGGKYPSMVHAGVYGAVMHYLKAVEALKGDDGTKVVAKMKELPTDDPLFGKGSIRADGRKIHPAYLVEVKKPAESKGPYDYYKVRATIPADQAFRPIDQGNCPLVAKK